MIYIIVYTPNFRNEINPSLVDAIKEYPSWAKINNDTYLIADEGKEHLSAFDIRKKLVSYCFAGDRLFVGYLTQDASWEGYNARLFAWIKEHDNRPDSERNVNNSRICDYQEPADNLDDKIQKMVAKWASTWNEQEQMKFNCSGNLDPEVLISFIAEVYSKLRRNVFVGKIRLVNFPEALRTKLKEALMNVCIQKQYAPLADEEFDGLFIANVA